MMMIKKITRKAYPDKNKFDLVTQKGFFPYDFVDDFNKLELTNLPSKNDFYPSFNDWNISDKDHSHARKVWETSNVKTLGGYSDIYLKTDILLLADIFENCRAKCLLTYELDALHLCTSPSLSMQAMLKMTGVEIELLTDAEMMLFVESRIRGGMVQCSNR